MAALLLPYHMAPDEGPRLLALVLPAPGSLFFELLRCAKRDDTVTAKDAKRRARVHHHGILLRWLALNLEAGPGIRRRKGTAPRRRLRVP